jgi:hypothetical protein
MAGEPFMREKTLTAAVWRGGDRIPDSGGRQVIIDYLRERDAHLCGLLKCLTQQGGVISVELEKRMQVLGIDIADARKCLEKFCDGDHYC